MVDKKAQWVEVLVTKTDGLSSAAHGRRRE